MKHNSTHIYLLSSPSPLFPTGYVPVEHVSFEKFDPQRGGLYGFLEIPHTLCASYVVKQSTMHEHKSARAPPGGGDAVFIRQRDLRQVLGADDGGLGHVLHFGYLHRRNNGTYT